MLLRGSYGFAQWLPISAPNFWVHIARYRECVLRYAPIIMMLQGTGTILPPELICKVIGTLHPQEDQAALLACSQVSYMFLPNARHSFFSSITVDVSGDGGKALQRFIAFVQNSVEFAKSSALSIPCAYTFIREVYITERSPVYPISSTYSCVSVNAIQDLLCAVPFMRALTLRNIRLSAECGRALAHDSFGATKTHTLENLTIELDTLEVDDSLASLLDLFARINRLQISCRTGRRLLGCPYLSFPFHSRFRQDVENATSTPLLVQRLELDCDIHLSHTTDYLQRRQVYGLKELFARCYSDEGLPSLLQFLHGLAPTSLIHLHLDTVNPGQEYPLAFFAYIAGLSDLTLSGPIYRPKSDTTSKVHDPSTRYWPITWTALAHSNSTLRRLTLRSRIRGDDAHIFYVLQDSLDWLRLEALLLVWSGLEDVSLEFEVPRSISIAHVAVLEEALPKYMPRLNKKVALQTIVKLIL